MGVNVDGIRNNDPRYHLSLSEWHFFHTESVALLWMPPHVQWAEFLKIHAIQETSDRNSFCVRPRRQTMCQNTFLKIWAYLWTWPKSTRLRQLVWMGCSPGGGVHRSELFDSRLARIWLQQWFPGSFSTRDPGADNKFHYLSRKTLIASKQSWSHCEHEMLSLFAALGNSSLSRSPYQIGSVLNYLCFLLFCVSFFFSLEKEKGLWSSDSGSDYQAAIFFF